MTDVMPVQALPGSRREPGQTVVPIREQPRFSSTSEIKGFFGARG